MDFYLVRNTPSAIGPAHVVSSEGEENSLIFQFLGGDLGGECPGEIQGLLFVDPGLIMGRIVMKQNKMNQTS